MPTLVLNAGTASPVNLVVQTAGENAPTEIGTVTPSFLGADRSSVRAVKRNYGSLTTYVSTAVKDSIINLLKNGRQISCSGDLLANIQTQCTVRYTGATMTPSLVDTWTVGLALNEVQPNNILLRYAPGDTITGETFSRAGTSATYRDANGNVVGTVANQKRDNHYVNGVRSILLEDTSTNICLQSETLGTTWGTSAATISSNATLAPSTAVTGDKIQEDNTANIHGIIQTITCAQASQTFSVWVKAAERTKCVIAMNDNALGSAAVGVDLSNGATFAHGLAAGAWTAISSRVESWGNGWWRIFITGTRGAGTQTVVEVLTWTTALSYVGTTGSGLYGWGAQLEMLPLGTSYINTTVASVARSADSYSLPAPTPGEFSVYAKFAEGGTIIRPPSRIWQISDAGSNAPALFAYSPAGFYSTFHSNAVVAVGSTLLTAPSVANVTELLSHLFGDGSVDTTQSINSGPATNAAQSAAAALATAWSGPLLWLNSAGTVGGLSGFTAIQSFKIVAGARALDEMRAA